MLRNIVRLISKSTTFYRQVGTKSHLPAICREVCTYRPIQFFFVYSFFGIPFRRQSDPTSFKKMSSDNLSDVLQHADQLFDEDNYQETVNVLKGFSTQDQYEIKWRLARALYSISKTADSKAKKDLIVEGFTAVQEALALKDDDFAGHKWMAILLDAKSGQDGIKERVSQLENVKKHMEKAVELNPLDPTSWYILGEFAFGLAELPWYTRKLLNTIFASPPNGSFEEAVGYFENAEKLQPGFYSMNLLMLGKCYYQLNNKEKAKEWLSKAVEINVKNDDDKKCKEEALKLIKKV